MKRAAAFQIRKMMEATRRTTFVATLPWTKGVLLVIPFSPNRIPRCDGEILSSNPAGWGMTLSGRNQNVLQVWNARTLALSVLNKASTLSGRLPREDSRKIKAILRQEWLGEKVSEDLENLLWFNSLQWWKGERLSAYKEEEVENFCLLDMEDIRLVPACIITCNKIRR